MSLHYLGIHTPRKLGISSHTVYRKTTLLWLAISSTAVASGTFFLIPSPLLYLSLSSGHASNHTCLARSAKFAERAICFTDRNFYLFLSSTSFLMISRRQIISRSTRPIFAIFTSNESILAVDDRSGPLFSISQGTLPWQPILCKNGKTPHFRRSGIQKRYGISLRHRYVKGSVNSGIDACILCEHFVKFGPVTPELTGLIWERLVWHGQKMDLFGLISPDVLDWFSQSLHRTKGHYVQMMDL